MLFSLRGFWYIRCLILKFSGVKVFGVKGAWYIRCLILKFSGVKGVWCKRCLV